MGWKKYAEDKRTEEKLREIWKNSRQDEEEFSRGCDFASLCAIGHKRTEAYIKAYDVSADFARSNATNKFRAKWIQDLIDLLHIPEDNRYRSIQIDMITKLQKIMNKSKDEQNVLSAIRQLDKMTQTNSKKNDEEEKTKEKEESPFSEIMKQIEHISTAGKMIRNGEIQDVTIFK